MWRPERQGKGRYGRPEQGTGARVAGQSGRPGAAWPAGTGLVSSGGSSPRQATATMILLSTAASSSRFLLFFFSSRGRSSSGDWDIGCFR
ncbi:hypothetical protein GQ55_7G137700 [Panicum hallii var. hallii]|uniref:Uncharacterized protein n=1 Tax=Panicum hallii var. hallii TaxID=1504633 RepID=A0A2T7CUV0_9POAL|nr:hypothetical protein GQ55_7G137700 [Panicum hallii var. hallii]